jgi:hypothetical protein
MHNISQIIKPLALIGLQNCEIRKNSSKIDGW